MIFKKTKLKYCTVTLGVNTLKIFRELQKLKKLILTNLLNGGGCKKINIL